MGVLRVNVIPRAPPRSSVTRSVVSVSARTELLDGDVTNVLITTRTSTMVVHHVLVTRAAGFQVQCVTKEQASVCVRKMSRGLPVMNVKMAVLDSEDLLSRAATTVPVIWLGLSTVQWFVIKLQEAACVKRMLGELTVTSVAEIHSD